MLITFKDIKKIDYFEEPKLLLLYWDIETSSSRGLGFFPVGEKENDYVYIIQFDIVFYNKSISRKRFCLSTIPINSQKFHSKYNSTELIFIELQTQEQLLLKFAELVGNYEPEFEISYNTSQFDWNFILKKARLLNIDDEFIRLLTKTKTTFQFNIQQATVRVVDCDIDKDNLKYEFAGINMNNRKIKISPNETMKCEFM
ncbi:7784_t:CDS:1 [Cetraspora pellucida]|uniref:7784_t:CDS:1 n=1 Tax=Cetraspora pellucida TaxID=1433469 RepID=A0A9N9I6W8_9GLOM|nr:7784_t:CDS:1 [Cetraspora pellucida]